MRRLAVSILDGVVSGIAFLSAVIFGFVAFASWSDFQNRGCGDMPSEDWIFTNNCEDAFTSSVISVGITLLGLTFLSVKLWRWLRG